MFLYQKVGRQKSTMRQCILCSVPWPSGSSGNIRHDSAEILICRRPLLAVLAWTGMSSGPWDMIILIMRSLHQVSSIPNMSRVKCLGLILWKRCLFMLKLTNLTSGTIRLCAGLPSFTLWPMFVIFCYANGSFSEHIDDISLHFFNNVYLYLSVSSSRSS